MARWLEISKQPRGWRDSSNYSASETDAAFYECHRAVIGAFHEDDPAKPQARRDPYEDPGLGSGVENNCFGN